MSHAQTAAPSLTLGAGRGPIPGLSPVEQLEECLELVTPMFPHPWRTLGKGHCVLTLPILFYCDDTSGNVSKKWNKHNSLLFTLAGLPRKKAQLPYNIHFLGTLNLAPPLEMFDLVAEMLE